MEESAHIVRDGHAKKSNPADSPGMSNRTLALRGQMSRHDSGWQRGQQVPFGFAQGRLSRACARSERQSFVKNDPSQNYNYL
jgi:hypothetical protein